MNAFTDLFIKRPVLASVVSLLILLIGCMAGLKLQVRQFGHPAEVDPCAGGAGLKLADSV